MKLFYQSLTESFRSLKYFDRITILYFVILTVFIVLFGNNIKNLRMHTLSHIAVIVLLWIGGVLSSKFSNVKFVKFLHYWYLPLIVTFVYWDCGRYIHLIFPGEFDWMIQKWEWSLFGVFPNQWVERLYNPILNEIMQLGYAVYWFTIPVSTAVLTFKNRFKEAEVLLSVTFSTFFLSYLIFIIIPVAGPRFNLVHLYTIPYDGLWLTETLRSFVGEAGLRGAAFPSSHVAVAISILMVMWKFERKWAVFFFLPGSVILSLATVYGRYHYFMDMWSGLLLGWVIGYSLLRYFSKKILYFS